ncbi:MAG: Ig-like domain-containing protein [Bacteroidales bacterium]|nr:Ig-like domain-containing protein [Bacteroidales bacterium]
MNLKHLLILAAVPLAMLVSCKPKELPAAITPTAASESLFTKGITAGSAASEVTVSFNSARQWKIASGVSWIVATPASGEAGDITAKLSIEANTSLDSRSATVTISSEEVSKTIAVTQSGRDRVLISGIVLNETAKVLYIGETVTLRATVTPSNADEDKTVTWSSDKPAVASVEDGVVTAKAEGEATITAKAGNVTATCKITVAHKVIDVESVILDITSKTIEIGDSFTITATVTPANADEAGNITWEVDKPEVASVSGGAVKGLTEGVAVITAKCGGKQATCTVTVNKKGSHGEDLDGEEDVDPWTIKEK